LWSALALLTLPAAAETDVSVFGGPAGGMLQDVKVRDFSTPYHQAWWEEHHVRTHMGTEEGVSVRHFFGRRFGVQGEFTYNVNSLSVDMENTQFGAFKMYQQRSILMVSAVGRHQMRWLGGSALYGSCGLGAVYADYSFIPDEWRLGGKFAMGLDLISARPANLFVELNYLWHQDVGGQYQTTGQHLKTSGNPTLNPAAVLAGPHYDTSIIGFIIGLRFRAGGDARKWYGESKTGLNKELTYGRQPKSLAN